MPASFPYASTLARRLGLLIALLLIATSATATPAKAKKHQKNKAKVNHHSPSQRHAAPKPAPSLGLRPELQTLAQTLAERQQLPLPWVRDLLGQARWQASVVQAMRPAPTGTPKNWATYRARFVEPRRIQAGVAFWRAHQAQLQAAQERTGVPMALIAGVLGVETLYGQQMGNYRVLDALTTLALDFPPDHPRAAERRALFESELGQFLRLAQQGVLDPLTVRGSYAGAMGLGQFMPSSWARFAVDGDDDGRIDLLHNAADAIASVANYFVQYGWQPGVPTHFAVQVSASPADLDALLAPDILPTFSAQRLQALGVALPETATTYPGKLALVELQNGSDPPTFVAGTDNFYAITRYNWSSYYAMAVIDLGNAVQAAVQLTDK
jgi:membrane-bound lytic murein transglycosylase B